MYTLPAFMWRNNHLKEIYKQLKELKLTHIFWGNLFLSLIIGSGAICILWLISLPHFIPVVLFMMYYFPLARMDMRRYLYCSRSKLEGLPDDQLFDALTLVHMEWNLEFSKPRWILRINILVFCIYAGSIWILRSCLLNAMPYGDLLFHITSTAQAGILAWFNIKLCLWLKEEIPLSNKELF